VRAKLARVGFPVLGAVLHGARPATVAGDTAPRPEALPPAPPTDDGVEAPVPAGAPQ
jgi:hypothetical protein